MSMIYLDHAATTQMTEEVERAMEPYLREKFGNASTEYSYGVDAGRAVEHCRAVIAETLEAKPEEIYFTSGGTECNNTIIRGITSLNKKRKNQISLKY